MKIKIKPFIRRLVKENIYYIIGNIFIFALIILTIRIGLTENANYQKKVNSLKVENSVLANKVIIMNNSIPKTDKLDEDVKFLNSLIPNAEDYFTVIYALEKLSQKSSFVITDYNVNVLASTSEKLRISITGEGNSKSFLDFLKDYNYAGGRLITSDKVQLDPNYSGSIKIDLTFYNKKAEANNKFDVSANLGVYKELEDLKAKVNFSFNDNVSSESANFDYPKKTNPF